MVDNNVRPESVPSRFVKRDGKTGGKVWKMLRDQIFMIFLYYMARFGLVGRPATLVVSTRGIGHDDEDTTANGPAPDWERPGVETRYLK